MHNLSDFLFQKAKDFNIELNSQQLEQFKVYWEFLNEYNSHTNLVSSTEIKTVYTKHFADSLAIGMLKDKIVSSGEIKLLDIGIGGGFPGMPLLIANKNSTLCAVDSVGKKTKFLEELAKTLDLSDRVEVINTRAEEIAFDESKRQQFDVVLARAVAQLNVITEYCLPFVKKGGVFVAYKAKNVETEVKQAKRAISELGGELEFIAPYEINDLDTNETSERNLVLIRKTKNTPSKYPRKTGIPKKNPL